MELLKKEKSFSFHWDRYKGELVDCEPVLGAFLRLWGAVPEVVVSKRRVNSLDIREGDGMSILSWIKSEDFWEEREELEERKYLEGSYRFKKMVDFHEINNRYGYFIQMRNEEERRLQVS